MTLIESNEILSMFDTSLRAFAQRKIEARPGMQILKQNVVKVNYRCPGRIQVEGSHEGNIHDL